MKHISITWKKVLETLKINQLFAKGSKCTFGEPQVEYLGHIILVDGVATDLKNMEAVQKWLVLRSIKELRGFLGLTCYYKKFIRRFSVISKPLTYMLKKNNFLWHEGALKAFHILKRALCEALVLAHPDFTTPFVLETNAYNTRIGAMFNQEGRPLAFLSKALGVRHLGLFIYKKEYLAIMMVVDK